MSGHESDGDRENRRWTADHGDGDGSRAISRRGALKAAGLGALALAGGSVLEGIRPAQAGTRLRASGSLKIGFVSPRTGPAAGFGEPDGYVLGLARKAFERGLTIGGT